MHNNAIYIILIPFFILLILPLTTLIPNSYSELESIQCPFVQMNSDSIVVSNLVTVSANFPGFQFSDRVTLSFSSDSHPFFATFFPNH